MDCLECKVCNIPYNEGNHIPRQAHCGHDFCSVCIAGLIKDGMYCCPTCRMNIRINAPADLPINFGLVDVIREFKAKNITNGEICKVHHKAISHRCVKCQTWLCGECLEFHSKHTGCSIISSNAAMETIRRENIKKTNKLLTVFDEDTNYLSSKMQEHTEKMSEYLKKMQKHADEKKKIQEILDQGKVQRNNLVTSRNCLNTASTPYALMDRIEVLTQRKQSIHSWAIKNIGTDSGLHKLDVASQHKLRKAKSLQIGKMRRVVERTPRHKITLTQGPTARTTCQKSSLRTMIRNAISQHNQLDLGLLRSPYYN